MFPPRPRTSIRNVPSTNDAQFHPTAKCTFPSMVQVCHPTYALCVFGNIPAVQSLPNLARGQEGCKWWIC